MLPGLFHIEVLIYHGDKLKCTSLGFNNKNTSKQNIGRDIFYPKYPDPSKVPILRTYTPLRHTGSYPSIGGSLGILRVRNIYKFQRFDRVESFHNPYLPMSPDDSGLCI